MNHRIVAKYLGWIMLVEGIFMIPAVLVALLYREPEAARALLPVVGITVAGGRFW